MAPTRNIGFDPRRPFTRADALRAGVSASALRGRSFRQIFHGVYVDAAVPPAQLQRIEAGLLIHPAGAFASHLSAAVVYGIPVPHDPLVHISVTDTGDRRRRRDLRCHVAPAGTPVNVVRGVPVSAPARLFVELAEVLTLVELVVAGDALVRQGLVTLGGLASVSAAATGRSAPLARRAASLVRENVDSPMESRLRMLLVLAGLPEPQVDFRVYDEHDRLLLRFDLSYPELRLAVEYDGRQHRDDLAQWDHDLDRQDWFDQNDWLRVAVVSTGVYRQPDKTIARVHQALQRRGCRTLPRRLSDEWRAHFPVLG